MTRFTRLRRSQYLVVVLGAMIAVLFAMSGGAAYGYFTSRGSGAGSAQAGSLRAVTVAAVTGAPTGLLVPGGSPTDVVVNVKNPNPYAVTVVAAAANGTITADSGHAACTTTGVSFINQSSLNITIPANQTSYPVDLPSAASMSTTSQSSCQSATFSIPVALTVHEG